MHTFYANADPDKIAKILKEVSKVQKAKPPKDPFAKMLNSVANAQRAYDNRTKGYYGKRRTYDDFPLYAALPPEYSERLDEISARCHALPAPTCSTDAPDRYALWLAEKGAAHGS